MSQTPSSPVFRPLPAALWMLGSVVTFVAIGVAGRQLKGLLDVTEIMLYRALTGVVIVLVLLVALRRLHQLRFDNLHWHGLRNTVHFLGMGLWLQALMLIPLAQLFAIEFTSPIWVILLAPLLLRERLTPVRLIAALTGFVGVLIVAKPDLADPDTGTVVAAASAVCFAVNIILTKRLTGAETILSILFWQTAMQSVLGLIVTGWDGAIALPNAQTLPWLLVIGLGGLVAHFCLTKALALAPAGFVIPIDFARLPIAAAVGWALWSEPVGLSLVFGGALIFLGNWINIRYGAK